MRVLSGLSGSVRNALQDRHRRYMIVSLLVLGMALLLVGVEAAGRGPALPKEPPSIQAVVVTTDRHEHCYLIQEDTLKYKVGRKQKYDFECIVADTRFALSYEWSCDAGSLSDIAAYGSMITWTGPDTSGQATVTVTVSDIAGQTATESVTLTVVSCSPCTFRGCG
jgi:hypothetical protein